MNNEPVAWMLLRNEVCFELTEWFGVMRGWEEFLGDNEKIVELYTYPVNPKYDPETGEPLIDGYPLFSGLPHPIKELTDEEILGEWMDEPLNYDGEREIIDFARAILRKAQEK